jgi:hypothetical protein
MQWTSSSICGNAIGRVYHESRSTACNDRKMPSDLVYSTGGMSSPAAVTRAPSPDTNKPIVVAFFGHSLATDTVCAE